MALTNPANFDDEYPSLGFVIWLRVEYLNKRLSFHQFLEKVYYHAITTYKDGGDLHTFFFNLTDFLDSLVTKHCPIKPESDNSEGVSVDEVDMEMYKEEIKKIVQRRMNPHNMSIEKSYKVIWAM